MCMKKCNKCGTAYPATKEYFYIDKHMADNLFNECKECVKRRARRYNTENASIIKKKRSERYRKNRMSILAQQKEKYYANHDDIMLQRKKWREANPEKVRELRKKDRENNIERIRSKDAEYRKTSSYIAKRKQYITDNKEKRRETRRVYDLERRKVDPQYKLLTNLRTRLNRAIRAGFKKGRTVELVGCSIEELKMRLESQFVRGMTWDNYGDWHVDHRIPCAAFDLSKPEEQMRCFHHSNLQPLWAEDNLRKWAKIA